VPYSFSNGTNSNASNVNQNFSSLQNCGNNIDYSNFGTAGIFASQIKPTTAGQATFGGSQAYTFPAGTVTIGNAQVTGNIQAIGTGTISTGGNVISGGTITNGLNQTNGNSDTTGNTVVHGNLQLSGGGTISTGGPANFGSLAVSGSSDLDLAVTSTASSTGGNVGAIAPLNDNTGAFFQSMHSVLITATSGGSLVACGPSGNTGYCTSRTLASNQKFNTFFTCSNGMERFGGVSYITQNGYPQSSDGQTFYLASQSHAGALLTTVCTGY
jgi:hypothetical protein